jgi:hypothetical protein
VDLVRLEFRHGNEQIGEILGRLERLLLDMPILRRPIQFGEATARDPRRTLRYDHARLVREAVGLVFCVVDTGPAARELMDVGDVFEAEGCREAVIEGPIPAEALTEVPGGAISVFGATV